MSDHEPVTGDQNDDQPGERLDAAKLPDEYPDRPVASIDHGTTELEMARGEALDGRLAREVPDDQPAQTALEDTGVTPLLDDADEDGGDREKDLVADMPLAEPHLDDSGHPDPPRSAEEAAIRIEGTPPGGVDHDVPAEGPDDQRATG